MMIQARQRNVRVFIFEHSDAQEIIEYLQKNSALLRSYLLLFKGAITQEVRACLERENLRFLDSFEHKEERIHHEIRGDATQLPYAPKEPHSNTKSDSTEKPIPTRVFRRTIRSGEEIETLGDVAIFGRVNSGAFIRAQGNVQIFGDIQGVVECDGEYMILGKIIQGSVLFNGEILESSLFDGGLKEVYIHDNRVVIKELL